MQELLRPTRAVIDLDALARNFRSVQGLVGEARIIAAVKGDGYGHGALPVARVLLREGAHKLGVALPEEGRALWEGGIDADVMVLGGIFPYQAPLVLRYDLEQTVFDGALLRALDEEAGRQGKRAKVHLKTDVGMHRLGARSEEELAALFEAALQAKNVDVVGFFTHFPDSYTNRELTLRQLSLFEQRAERARSLWPNILVHCANTAATLAIPETRLDCVRVGISLYGYNPSMNQNVQLTPIMRLVTRIEQIKELSPGDSVSYYCKWTAARRSRIAILPMGYTDLFILNSLPYGEVLVRGKRCPIVGAVCMDLMMIDITDIPAEVGDEVVVLGEQEGERIDLYDYTDWSLQGVDIAGVVSVGERVPRVYVGEE